MKKNIVLILASALLLTGCANEFNRIYKSQDTTFKYEAAKRYFAMGKFQNASVLLQDVVTSQKGRTTAQESLYMLGMAEYCNRDYETASATFRKYFTTYPKGDYAEQAAYYIGQSLYESVPEPRLDQTPTVGAISAYQNFLDYFPESELRDDAQQRLFKLQDNLVKKELLSAKLYYNLGGYFGNINANTESNYEACIITAENALKTFPYTRMREDLFILILRSRFQLAQRSVAEKSEERYRQAVDEYYGFKNEFPNSKYMKEAEQIYKRCAAKVKLDDQAMK